MCSMRSQPMLSEALVHCQVAPLLWSCWNGASLLEHVIEADAHGTVTQNKRERQKGQKDTRYLLQDRPQITYPTSAKSHHPVAQQIGSTPLIKCAVRAILDASYSVPFLTTEEPCLSHNTNIFTTSAGIPIDFSVLLCKKASIMFRANTQL